MKNKKISKTCIAIIKNRRGKLIMAGDRRVSTYMDTVYTSPMPKIMKKDNGILIGASGSSDVCHVITTGFEPPDIKKQNINDYMLFEYLPSLRFFLASQYDWINGEKLFSIPPGVYCSLLIGIYGDVYEIEIDNSIDSDKDYPHRGSMIIDRVPTPFVIGCGAIVAYPILQTEYKALGHNTREQLEHAMFSAADISSGCDNNIDYLKED